MSKIKQIAIHTPPPPPPIVSSCSSNSANNNNASSNNNNNNNNGNGKGRIARQQYIGFALVLFNALFLVALLCLNVEFRQLALRHWLLFAAYACSLPIAFLGICWHWSRLLWPLVILTVPFIVWPTLICGIFLLKLACPSIVHCIVPLMVRHNNGTTSNGTNWHFHYECPPLFMDGASNLPLLFSHLNATTMQPPMEQDGLIAEMHSASSSTFEMAKIVRFAAPGLLILTLISVEKCVEFLFLLRLIRLFGAETKDELEEEEDIFAIEERPGGNGISKATPIGSNELREARKTNERQKRHEMMKSSGSNGKKKRKQNGTGKRREREEKEEDEEDTTASEELECDGGGEATDRLPHHQQQRRNDLREQAEEAEEEDTVFAKGQFTRGKNAAATADGKEAGTKCNGAIAGRMINQGEEGGIVVVPTAAIRNSRVIGGSVARKKSDAGAASPPLPPSKKGGRVIA